MLVNLLGQWEDTDYGGESIPIGGLAFQGLVFLGLGPLRFVGLGMLRVFRVVQGSRVSGLGFRACKMYVWFQPLPGGRVQAFEAQAFQR